MKRLVEQKSNKAISKSSDVIEGMIKQFYKDFPDLESKTIFINVDKYPNFDSYIKDNSDVMKKVEGSDLSEILLDDLEFGFKMKKKVNDNGMMSYFKNKAKYGSYDSPLIVIFTSPSAMVDAQKGVVDMFNYYKQHNYEFTHLQQAILHHEIGHGLHFLCHNWKNIAASLSDLDIAQEGLTDEDFEKMENFDSLTDEEIEKYSGMTAEKIESDRLISEAIAESYALIRMYQERGLEDGFLNLLIQYRTDCRFFAPDDAHNFLPAIHEVVRQARAGELDDLTPKQSIERAVSIAEKYHLSYDDTQSLQVELKDAYNKMAKSSFNEGLELICKVASTTNSPAVLNDLQYTVQFIDDTGAAVERNTIKKIWQAMAQNKALQVNGWVDHHWRTSKKTLLTRPAIKV